MTFVRKTDQAFKSIWKMTQEEGQRQLNVTTQTKSVTIEPTGRMKEPWREIGLASKRHGQCVAEMLIILTKEAS